MEFDNIIAHLSENIKRTLRFVDENIKNTCEEIRLREGLPLCLTVGGKVLFVCKNSKVCDTVSRDVFTVTKDEIQETLSLLCNRSVYLHEKEIKQGFISLPYGCRAGVCGVFNSDGMLVSVRSINIRIARQIFDCARVLLPYARDGLLIAGPPGCGKTTLLRDLIRLLSNGENGQFYRVSVIDSRYEISGGGTLQLGVNTDVIYTLDKAKGVDIALRTMFPDFIAFDEVGTEAELKSLYGCFNAGVSVITTAHCNKKEDLYLRELIHKILENRVVENVALVSKNMGQPPQIFNLQEIKQYAFT